jgi:hypothetical protein
MSSPPLKRIYFDTNALFRWPRPGNDVFSLLGLAKWLKTELYIPESVEAELEGQFVRSVNSVCGDINSRLKELKKICRDIIDVPFDSPEAKERELREAFQIRSEQIKAYYAMTTIPTVGASVGTLLKMAINRDVPFEERTISKDRKGIVGFQDAVILFSILEHTKSAGAEDRCAFVTDDGVFHRPAMRDFLVGEKSTLEIVKPGKSLWEQVWEHVWGAIRTEWDRENTQVREDLENQKEQLAVQILPMLPVSELGRSAWKNVKEVTALSVREISLVRTELPDSDYRPPSAESYTRPDGSTVNISAKVDVDINAVAESYNILNLFLAQDDRGEIPPTPKSEQVTLHESLNVSLVGTSQGAVIGSFLVTEVQMYKYN